MTTDRFSSDTGKPVSNPALRLFCLPYAGGNVSIFRRWQREMPENVEVCPIELPGRGLRSNEPLNTRMEPLVEHLGRELLPLLDRPFALFGHSMGAILSFELARYVRNRANLSPAQLFVSGWRSPELMDERRDYDLPTDVFIAMLRRMNGTPDEILENPEALEFLLPIVRADFEAAQTYTYREDLTLSCPIKAFAGIKDLGTPPEMMKSWKNHTTSSFSITILPGDHFFVTQSEATLTRIIGHHLARLLDSKGSIKQVSLA
jgi:medium-chain acyl-[acyl-carrier-protein] hydrolase